MGIMRRRSIFEDIDRLLYDLLPDLLILTAIHKEDDLNTSIRTLK